MDLNNLPEIEFVSADKDKLLADVLALYKEFTGRTLAQGDPVRLFLNVIVSILIKQCAYINYTGKQNLLRYASGASLDHLGALLGVERNPATKASTTIKITLSEERAVSTLIPASTRFTAGDNVYFQLTKAENIPAGELTAEVKAECMVAGSIGNGYLVGEINTIVDPLPFVATASNVTVPEGGVDTQDDESFRAIIQEAPEKFATAGPQGAYEYQVKKASALVVDVNVSSPNPGEVQIVPMLVGGVIPGAEMLQFIKESLNDRRLRPLTDHIVMKAPQVVNYNVNLTYYINKADALRSEWIQAEVTQAVAEYNLWQSDKLGRDVNPSELILRVMQVAGVKRVVVASPNYQEISADSIAIVSDMAISMGGVEVE